MDLKFALLIVYFKGQGKSVPVPVHECNIIIEKVLYFIDEAESPGNLELQNGAADLDRLPLVLFFDLEG